MLSFAIEQLLFYKTLQLSNVTKGDKPAQEDEVESEDIKKIKKVSDLY